MLTAQDLTMSLEKSAKPGPFTSIAVNVVFPAGAGVDAVYTGGVVGVQRVANISAGAPSVFLPLDTTVAVRSAGGVVAFRIPYADSLAGLGPANSAVKKVVSCKSFCFAEYEVTSWLKFDGPSGTDAARLVTYLYRGPNVTFPAIPPPSRSITLMVVAEASSDGDVSAVVQALAAMTVSNATNSTGGDVHWRVSVVPPASHSNLGPGFGSALETSFSIPRKAILYRSVNGSSMTMPAAGALELSWSNGTRAEIRPENFTEYHEEYLRSRRGIMAAVSAPSP